MRSRTMPGRDLKSRFLSYAAVKVLNASRRGFVDGAAWKVMPDSRPRMKALCTTCGHEFMAALSQIKRGKGRCCSLSCAAALAAIGRDQKGAANNNWKGGISRTPEQYRAYKSAYRRRHRERHLAHKAVQDAVARGTLTRGACEVCGEPESHAHHDDYSRRLDVRWLCKTHHKLEHSKQE